MHKPTHTSDPAPAPEALDCLIVADDLTGACDSAVHFAIRGRRTTVYLDESREIPSAEVIAITTDTRDVEPSTAGSIVAEATSRWRHFSPAVLFKKVDSTLRGNVREEIAGVLAMSGYDAAVICPAFPKLRRIVERGCLRIQDALDFQPIEISDCLHHPNLEPCVSVSSSNIVEAVAGGARLIVADAVTDDDLDRLVRETLRINRRVLWVGSGGLASALARTLVRKTTRSMAKPISRGPVVFCVGSDHAVTALQQAHLRAHRPVLTLPSFDSDRGDMTAALQNGHHVWIDIPRAARPEGLRNLVAGTSPAPLLLCGGHTASLIFRSNNIYAMDIFDEILPGIPYGAMRGGDADGRTVITKSGAFGSPDTLVRIADLLS